METILSEMNMVAEGVNTARVALDLAEHHSVELPICQEIHKVITGRQRPADAYRGLREPGHESEPG